VSEPNFRPFLAILRDRWRGTSLDEASNELEQLLRMFPAGAALPVPAPQAVPVITEDPEANGDLDDLFVNGGIDSFHVERMDSGHWWFAVYLNDGTRLNFNLHSSRKITARVEREETGPIRAALPVPALDALTYERAWMDLMDEARAFEEAVIADLIGIARDYRARRDAEHAALGEDVK